MEKSTESEVQLFRTPDLGKISDGKFTWMSQGVGVCQLESDVFVGLAAG